MPKLTKCWYRGCGSDNRANPKLQFYKFPKDLDRCEQWVNSCANDQLTDIWRNSPRKLGTFRVCQKHFLEQFLGSGRLVNHAVPAPYGVLIDPETFMVDCASLKSFNPNRQQPLAQPVYQQSMAQPVYQQSMAQPVYQQSMAQPLYQQPLAPCQESPSQLVYQQPSSQSVYQQPPAQHLYQPPEAQPLYQQPEAQPLYQQPEAQPPYQQPPAQHLCHPPEAQSSYQQPPAQHLCHPPEAQPPYQQPPAEHLYQPPETRSLYKQPEAQPVYQQPTAQNLYQQPPPQEQVPITTSDYCCVTNQVTPSVDHQVAQVYSQPSLITNDSMVYTSQYTDTAPYATSYANEPLSQPNIDTSYTVPDQYQTCSTSMVVPETNRLNHNANPKINYDREGNVISIQYQTQILSMTKTENKDAKHDAHVAALKHKLRYNQRKLAVINHRYQKLRAQVKGRTHKMRLLELFKTCKNDFDPCVYELFKRQIKGPASKHGNRWSEEVKSFSSGIYIRSRSAYRFIRRTIDLPSESIVKRYIVEKKLSKLQPPDEHEDTDE